MSVSVKVLLMYVHIIFSSAELVHDQWPPFCKELLTWLAVCCLCIISRYNSRFCFEGKISLIIVPVAGHFLPYTLMSLFQS